MNTKSIALKVATLGLTVAAVFVNAQSPELVGSVPMDFKIFGKKVEAGAYRIAEQRPGVVIFKHDRGANVAVALLPIQTKSNSTKNVMTFDKKAGEFHLTSYCVAGRGCWSGMTGASSSATSERIEIALSR